MDPKFSGTPADAPSLPEGESFNSNGPSVLQVHADLVSKHVEAEQAAPSDPSGNPQPTDASSVPFSPSIDPGLVRKGVRSILQAVDGVLCRKIYRAALTLTADEGTAKNFATDAGLTKDEAELMADMSTVLCEKYRIAGQYAPEALLCLAIVGYTTRTVLTFKKLEDLARIKAKSDRGRPAVILAEPDGA